MLDCNSLDNIVINENNSVLERPKVAYNNFFCQAFKPSNHGQMEESPVVSNDQFLPKADTNQSALRGISQMNPLAAISNPNFSGKNPIDEDDALIISGVRKLSEGSEVNLHNVSTEQVKPSELDLLL